jgi:predicted N-acetyltransferase YhbS
MIHIRNERLADLDAREALLDASFGETRTRKSSERLREDRLPAEGLSFIASEGRRVIGTARLWNVSVGNGKDALLLGPVAVAEDCRSKGLGGAMVRPAIRNITSASASQAPGPARCGCRARSSGTACSAANSWPARSTARAA